MTADPRVTAARQFIEEARPRHDVLLPASVLTRMFYELRRHAAGLLAVIDAAPEAPEAGGRVLSRADLEGIYSALADAAACIEDRAARQCDACDAHHANLCAQHDADLDTVTAYRALAARLGQDASAPDGIRHRRAEFANAVGDFEAGQARQLAEVRAVLAAFDWETDDRQYALEKIDRIVTPDGEL